MSFLIVMTRNNYPGKVLSKSSAEPRNGLLRARPETVYSSQRMRIRDVRSDSPPPHPNPQPPPHPPCRFHQTQRKLLQDAVHTAGAEGAGGIGKEHEMNTGLPFRVIHHFHNVYCNPLVVRPRSADQ